MNVQALIIVTKFTIKFLFRDPLTRIETENWKTKIMQV